MLLQHDLTLADEISGGLEDGAVGHLLGRRLGVASQRGERG